MAIQKDDKHKGLARVYNKLAPEYSARNDFLFGATHTLHKTKWASAVATALLAPAMAYGLFTAETQHTTTEYEPYQLDDSLQPLLYTGTDAPAYGIIRAELDLPGEENDIDLILNISEDGIRVLDYTNRCYSYGGQCDYKYLTISNSPFDNARETRILAEYLENYARVINDQSSSLGDLGYKIDLSTYSNANGISYIYGQTYGAEMGRHIDSARTNDALSPHFDLSDQIDFYAATFRQAAIDIEAGRINPVESDEVHQRQSFQVQQTETDYSTFSMAFNTYMVLMGCISGLAISTGGITLRNGRERRKKHKESQMRP